VVKSVSLNHGGTETQVPPLCPCVPVVKSVSLNHGGTETQAKFY